MQNFKPKQSLTKRKGPQGQKEKKQQPLLPPAFIEPSSQKEALYGLVRQDTELREYHVGKLLATSGYGHLTAEAAEDMVEQLLQLSTLLYEMLSEQQKEEQADKGPHYESLLPETKSRYGKKQVRR